MFSLKTARLEIRDWRIEDVDAAFAMYGDPDVMRYLGDGVPTPDLETQRARLAVRIKKYGILAEQGMGVWAVVESSTNAVVGTVLLKPLPPSTEDIEIGWHLAQRSWGQGYASETAMSLLEYGFGALKQDRIYAVVRPGNDRSIAVTRRIGMRPLGRTTAYYDGEELELFVIEREGCS